MGFDYLEISLKTGEGFGASQDVLFRRILGKAMIEASGNGSSRQRNGGNTRPSGSTLPIINQPPGAGTRNPNRSRLNPGGRNSQQQTSYLNARRSQNNFASQSLNASPQRSAHEPRRRKSNVKLNPIKKLPEPKKKYTLEDLGNIGLAAPNGNFLVTGIRLDPRSTYKIKPYKPPRARRVRIGGLDLTTKNLIREILAGLHYLIRKEIERQQLTFVELTRIRKEALAIKDRTLYANLIIQNWIKGSEGYVLKMTDHYEKYFDKEINVHDGNLVQVVCCDSSGEAILEPLIEGQEETGRAHRILDKTSELKAKVDVNQFFIDSYFDDCVSLSFDQMLDVLDGRFKNEFKLRCDIIDEVTRISK